MSIGQLLHVLPPGIMEDISFHMKTKLQTGCYYTKQQTGDEHEIE